jgi:hypothetical protein
MADDQGTGPSGSRWEPAPDLARDPGPDSLDEDRSAAATARSGDPAPTRRRTRVRTRVAMAGAATALALGGLAGFAIAHTTTGEDDVRPADITRRLPASDEQGPASFGHDDRGGTLRQSAPHPDDSDESPSSGDDTGTGAGADPT